MSTQITLPRDAEGREIPLDTEIVYSKEGNKLCISHIEFSPLCKEWTLRIVGIDGKIFRTWVLYPWQAYIEKPAQPDSWDKLEEDLDRAVKNDDKFGAMACAYMNRSGDMCGDCKFYDDFVKNCSDQMVKDVASRIRNLRGDGE